MSKTDGYHAICLFSPASAIDAREWLVWERKVQFFYRGNVRTRPIGLQTVTAPVYTPLKRCRRTDGVDSTTSICYGERYTADTRCSRSLAGPRRFPFATIMVSSPRRRLNARIPVSWALFLLCLSVFLQPAPSSAIKFSLPSYRFPPVKCIWNPAHEGALVIVTANVGPGESQRVDVEIIDSSEARNVYLRKKDIRGETRLAITTHTEGDVGVCFRNFMDGGTHLSRATYRRILLTGVGF